MVTALEVPTAVYKIPRDVILSYNSKKRIGNYLIGKTIGEGAFAKVKEALHVVTGEKVAVKIIDKTKAKQDNYLWKNLRREVKLLQYMRHPNVVGLYESLETELAYYLVLEHIRGGEMKDYIARSERLSEAEAKKYTRQLISALWHVHSAGVIHRDLKVENIMLDERGNVKIIDFGLSNSVKSLEQREGKGTQCGSPAYAAPELLANKGYDKRVDIWAIGINMFAMLAGKLPFKVKPFNLKKLYQKMVTSDMELLPPNISDEAKDLLKRLLNPDPNDRITLTECTDHPWLECDSFPIEFTDYPNLPVTEDLNQEVLQYLADYHNVNIHSLILDLLTHNMNTTTATYHYMCHKFDSKKSKAKPTKRRPKTAGTALSTKKVEKQSSVEEAGKPSTRPRRHSIAIPRNKHVDSSSPKVVPGTIKPCFEKVTNTPPGVRSDHKAVEHTFNTNSVITATRTKSAVVSCKSRIETLDQSNLGRYDENVKMIQDGRLLNRSHVKSNYLKQKEKQLIRTVYTPSIRTNRTLSAPTTAPSEPLYARGQTRCNDERARYEDRTATIYNKSNQWPSRQNSAKTSGQDPFFRPSATYKWREHDHNTLLQNIALNRRFSYR